MNFFMLSRIVNKIYHDIKDSQLILITYYQGKELYIIYSNDFDDICMFEC